MPDGLPVDFPIFDNHNGTQKIWDPTSQSYIDVPIADDRPDRGHSTGGDNDLFDPFQHTEQEGVPELEGYMAKVAVEWAPRGQVKCPNCETATKEQLCPVCHKDLTPEWNKEEGNEFFDVMPEHSDASEYTSWPERQPKRNREKTDDSYPSMSLSKTAADDWDFDIGTNEGKTEIGRWLVDKQGQFHFMHGTNGYHDDIAERDGLQWPADVACYGSVYNDGTAEINKVLSGRVDPEAIQAQISQAFGPVTLAPVAQQKAGTKGETFQSFQIGGGYWLVPPQTQPITGLAWVSGKSQEQYNPTYIMVVDHLTPEDFALYMNGAKAIITATGGTTSHAAQLARQEGIPVVVGLGTSYNKIEAGNYLKIDAPTKTITVMPGATTETDPGTKQQAWDSIHQFQLQHGGSVKPQFAHVDEETAWNLVHGANLDSCPECDDVMHDQDGEKVCHGCGHKQPIIKHEAGMMALPLLGEAASAIGGEGMGGLMTKALQGGAFRAGENALGGGQHGGVGAPNPAGPAAPAEELPTNAGVLSKELAKYKQSGVISEALQAIMEAFTDPKNPLSYIDDIAGAAGQSAQQQTQQTLGKQAKDDTFGEEETGWATKNRGSNSDPEEASSSGIAGEAEHGDGPEQLKDVDGIGGPQSPDAADDKANQGDPQMQDKALKAFHINMPLVLEFANSDEAGADNPIIAALDELLEAAFPGYKDGHDQQDGAQDEHPVNDAPSEDESGDAPEDGDSKDKQDPKEASVWHFAYGDFDGPDTGYDSWNHDPEAEQTPDCPQCGGPGTLLGQLGRQTHYRCRNCGWDYSEDGSGQMEAPQQSAGALPPEDQYGVHARVAAEISDYGDFVKEGFAPMPNYGMPPDQGAPGAVSVNPTCPLCGQSHIAGTPCPQSNTAVPNQSPVMNGAPITPPMPNKVVTNYQEDADAEEHDAQLRKDEDDKKKGAPGSPLGKDEYPWIEEKESSTKWQVVAFGGMQQPQGQTPSMNPAQAMPPAAAPAPAADPAAGSTFGVTPCPNCGQNGVPPNGGPCQSCGADASTGPVGSELPAQNGAPVMPGLGVSTGAVDDDFGFYRSATPDEIHDEAHDTSSDWVDESGSPLEEGEQYEMKTGSFAIPDKVTIEQILPHKITYLVHGDVDYRHSVTKDQLATDGTTFVPVNEFAGSDSDDGGWGDENPTRPGQDSGFQQDDLSSPATVVSAVVEAGLDDRSWLMEDSAPVEVDPQMLAKLAGKDYSPREQRGFIEEAGEARNLDRLDLEGTHYLTDELDTAFNW